MKKKAWVTRAESVVNLSLDNENIRLDLHGQSASQDALIHDLFLNQDGFELLKLIAQHGFFLHELPIIVDVKGHPVVLEGNRRVAVLKAAITPGLVPSCAQRIEAIKKGSPHFPINTIEVKVAPSRQDAMPLIASIHTVTSRKPWAPLRQAYFYYAQIESGKKDHEKLVQEFPEAEIPRFIRMWEMHKVARSIKFEDPEEASKAADQQRFQITTFERLYDSKPFQQSFHISFDEFGRLSVNAEEKGFRSAIKCVVQDIVNRKVTSRSLNLEKDIKKALTRWNLPSKKLAGKPLRSESFKPIPAPKKSRIRKGLAPKEMVCTIPFPYLERILEELQTIDYMKFPNATHDLLRSFLECSLKAYFKHNGIKISGGRNGIVQLKDVLVFSRGHFNEKEKGLAQVITLIESRDEYVCSLEYLNAVNHNPNIFSTGPLVKEAWDQMMPLLRFVLASN